MNPINQLNTMIANQKTVSTTKLVPVLKSVIKMQDTINSQRNSFGLLNKRYQDAKRRADDRLEMVEQYERLKIHHRNLEREYNLLLEKVEKIKK